MRQGRGLARPWDTCQGEPETRGRLHLWGHPPFLQRSKDRKI